jgi:hypothetical protein
MPRTRSFSIVKPPQSGGEGESLATAPAVDTLHEEAELEHSAGGDGDVVHDHSNDGVHGEGDGQESGKPQLVRYTEIR